MRAKPLLEIKYIGKNDIKLRMIPPLLTESHPNVTTISIESDKSQ